MFASSHESHKKLPRCEVREGRPLRQTSSSRSIRFRLGSHRRTGRHLPCQIPDAAGDRQEERVWSTRKVHVGGRQKDHLHLLDSDLLEHLHLVDILYPLTTFQTTILLLYITYLKLLRTKTTYLFNFYNLYHHHYQYHHQLMVIEVKNGKKERLNHVLDI